MKSPQKVLQGVELATPDSYIPQDHIIYFDNPPGYLRLIQGVIIQAAMDARKGDQEAAAWLADPETANTWLSVAGLDRRAVERWVEAGCKLNRSKNSKKIKGI
ncbi:MAG: hypothetical protein D4R70_00120 [Betaproteobacteria bacterium]|nr:MAG: hypothetical protein D4R70_00120 [Betaproteobacteria bacterium]